MIRHSDQSPKLVDHPLGAFSPLIAGQWKPRIWCCCLLRSTWWDHTDHVSITPTPNVCGFLLLFSNKTIILLLSSWHVINIWLEEEKICWSAGNSIDHHWPSKLLVKWIRQFGQIATEGFVLPRNLLWLVGRWLGKKQSDNVAAAIQQLSDEKDNNEREAFDSNDVSVEV